MAFDLEGASELVLALMQLGLHEGTRTWKSYDWTVLDNLFERGLISDPKSKAKSVVLTAEGMALSCAMGTKYLSGRHNTHLVRAGPLRGEAPRCEFTWSGSPPLQALQLRRTPLRGHTNLSCHVHSEVHRCPTASASTPDPGRIRPGASANDCPR